MTGLLSALGLGGNMGGDGQQVGMSPLLTSLLSGVSSQAGAPDWLKSVSSWAQDPATQSAFGQFGQAMQGANRQEQDRLYDLSSIDPRQANPYADTINEPQMRSLGLQTNAGRQMTNQGVQNDIYGPMIKNFLNSGVFKDMWTRQQPAQKQAAPGA